MLAYLSVWTKILYMFTEVYNALNLINIHFHRLMHVIYVELHVFYINLFPPISIVYMCFQ